MIFHPAFFWFLLGLTFIGAEFLVPGFVIFFFGAGALINGILSILIPGLRDNFVLQGIIWIATSSLSLAFLRKYLSRVFRGKLISQEDDSMIGNSAEVLEDITPDSPGRIKIGGTSWNAVSYTETFAPGDTVEILKQEGLTLIVTKPFMENSTQPDKN